MSGELVPVSSSEIAGHVDHFSSGLTSYLANTGLPTQGVLVDVQERATVLTQLPAVAGELSDQQRGLAMYVSKFVAACGAGLFDAALNYLWDETIRDLRSKVARFDLAYFYDAVITDTKRRAKYQSEDHLADLQDWELIRGCRDTGLITDIGYRHLDYIRDMRNHASAAHPNQNDLSGLQLLSWLQVCIREVLSKEPSGAVIEVGRLLRSLREEVFAADSIAPVAHAVQSLPSELSVSLLRNVFGMFCDQTLGTQVRANIQLIAPAMWAVVDPPARHDIGFRHASYSANGEVNKAALAHQFLQIVDGLAYLSEDVRALELNGLVNSLETAHNGFDNFHTEAPVARSIRNYIPANGQIPAGVKSNYVKVLVMCRIGNGYGVSWAACDVYDELIGKFQDDEIKLFCHLAMDAHVSSRLQAGQCAQHYQELAQSFLARVSNQALKQVLEFIMGFRQELLHKMGMTADFKKLIAQVA